MGQTLKNEQTATRIAKALLLIFICALLAGVSGVLTALLMFWMTRQDFAVDNQDKHGISHQRASRLGGVAVGFCALCIYWISVGLSLPLERLGISLLASPVPYAVLIGIVGLCDDACGHLSAYLRIMLTSILFAAFLVINQGIIPQDIGILGIDALLATRSIAYLLCLFACLGMLNATNMADGANGLMPLVFMGTFYGYFVLSGELLYLAVTMGLMVFTIFNVLSGRLFLGDSGSYGLGALAALGALKLMSEIGAEVWFFLCLAAYPVIDFFVSIVRRKLAGKSPLSPDSDHMHNRVYRLFRRTISSPLMANSLSGLTISIGTTGVSVALLSLWSVDSRYWVLLFLCIVVIYLFLYLALPPNELATES
jgi:UDP-GlcNAc:undecaprenyl-phosphate/decaprenyl-phosphate GlcNAc-1-phosphate transferase